ncbi:sugar-binding domain-containing protein [Oleiharenicola sp. Vm1]|uniref:sugar-binding domain-containing protein n=1 Tax=Oleiharenicola sp. Vm1 TaxID=3398393 RepID=UPI0039F45771
MKFIRCLLFAAFAATGAAATEPPRERLPFNDGWKFTRGDHPDTGNALDYERVRLWVLPTGDELLNYLPVPRARSDGMPGGRPIQYARADFDDGAWRALTLPHDWAIEGPFDQQLSGDTGKLPYADVGWYRKKFTLPASDAGRRVHLEFDGAMSYALVWCNGEFVGGWPYGYTSWRVDLTRFLKPGAENTLAVRLDNPRESSRWYPGAGLYRNVWLSKSGDVAVARWGVAVTTPQVSAESALVNVAVTLDNLTAEPAEVQAVVRLFAADADGRAVGEPVAESAPQGHACPPAGRRTSPTRSS